MKWIGYLLVIAIIIALITSPSEKKFRKFINNEMDTSVCQPSVQHKTYGLFSLHLFSIDVARECKDMRVLSTSHQNNLINKAAIPVYGKEVVYLGLFGKFWKL